MIDLSICVPSNRKLIDCQSSIDSAIQYISQRKNSELHVSDNSSDISKLNNYTSNNSNNFIYKNNNGLSEMQNWRSASLNAKGYYVGYLADDDYIHLIGKQQLYERNSQIVGYRPNFVVWEEGNGIIKTSNFSILENDSKSRIESYFNKCNGNNNTLYSFIKNNITSDIIDLCVLHPVKSGYYDWAIVLAYISSGILIEDNSTIYVYDNRNWSGSQEKINETIEKLMIKGGLDNRGKLFINLLLAIDSYILIGRKSSPVDREQLFDAAQYSMFSYLNSFLKFYNENKIKYTAKEQREVEKIINSKTISELLKAILNLIGAYNEKLVENYIVFYKIALESNWGDF